MTGKRKRYAADFKAKVALEALRGELTTAQLATKHGIHQTMVGQWKKQAVEGLTAVFSDRSAAHRLPSRERRSGNRAMNPKVLLAPIPLLKKEYDAV
jgi:transposase